VEKLSSSSELTIGELLRRGAVALEGTSASARLDSEVLLGYLLAKSRTQLLVYCDQKVSGDDASRFGELVERRRRGEPIAYITGEREFWGLSFRVAPGVLVPRPESELLIEEALVFAAGQERVRFLDLGVGSGCLSIAIISELTRRGVDVQGVGVDLSQEALAAAARNAELHGVADRLKLTRGDWFKGIDNKTPPFDLIIANPPYIDPNESVPVELSFEPRGALFAEERGLKDARLILEQSGEWLRVGGMLVCEVGAGKRGLLEPILGNLEARYHISLLGDDSPHDRFTVLRLIRR
jgi:release factor glutamine methyltransferase